MHMYNMSIMVSVLCVYVPDRDMRRAVKYRVVDGSFVVIYCHQEGETQTLEIPLVCHDGLSIHSGDLGLRAQEDLSMCCLQEPMAECT